jgi:glycosyltransferase involved in cell wall biosynthesis
VTHTRKPFEGRRAEPLAGVAAGRLRLGVYTDMVFRRDGGGVFSTDLSFILFLTALAPRLGEVVLFGRLDPAAGRSPYELPKQGVRLVPFPYYPRVTSVGRMARSLAGARAAFTAELEHLDAVWLFGPHPLALEFARIARRRQIPVFLGIRQDFPSYIGGRLPSRAWLWAVPAAHALELAFRRLARGAPTVVVGDELARVYARAGGPLLATTVSLVRDDDIIDADRVLARPWNGELRLLSVGRLEAEKNPLLLPEILARLRQRYGGWHMTVVGSGPLASAVQDSARMLGVEDAFELKGYVPFGPPLWAIYRASHAFLHVSLTEGLPQVLLEAEAAGLPIVATDVGGVRSALGDGRLGLVVPPRNADAAVDALERLRSNGDLRRELIERGLAAVRETTVDAELQRVVEFFESQLAAV